MHPDRSRRLARGKLLEESLTHEIIGGFFESYNELGFGFKESICTRALEIVLRKRGLIVEREFPVEVFFRGEQIGFHRVDMLVEGRVIVEVKATHKLIYAHKLQLINYLRAMNLEVGLLLHFGPRARFVRVLAGWKIDEHRVNPGAPGNSRPPADWPR